MTDPIQSLPFDLIAPTFSSFSTPQLALLASVSQDWRRILQSDPSLTLLVDLTNLEPPLGEMEMTKVVHRLSSLSTHSKNELRLDLSSFWINFYALASVRSNVQGKIMESRPNGYISLLSTIQMATKGRLDKLFLVIPRDQIVSRTFSGCYEDDFRNALIEGWAELSTSMDHLREVHFQIPCRFSLDAGARDGRAKRFTLTGLTYRAQGGWTISQLEDLLDKVTTFTGEGPNQLSLSTGGLMNDEEETDVQALLQMLHPSKDFLKDLDLTIGINQSPELVLAFILSCPKLEELQLSFIFRRDDRDVQASSRELGFPEMKSAAPDLKTFKFHLERLSFDWSSPFYLNYMGHQLEKFALSLSSADLFDTASFGTVPLQSLNSIISTNPLLQEIDLSFISISKSFEPFSISSWNLPHLKSLKLSSVYSAHEIFANAFLPALEHLVIENNFQRIPQFEYGVGFQLSHRIYMDPTAEPSFSTFTNVHSILSNCHLTLKVFKLIDSQRERSGRPEEYESLLFPMLEDLSISSTSGTMGGLVSKFDLPNLKRLDLSLPLSDLVKSSMKVFSFSSNLMEHISLSSSSGALHQGLLKFATEEIRSFPKLESLELKNIAAELSQYFSLCTFDKLEILKTSASGDRFSFKEEKMSEPSKKESLKAVAVLIQINAASLREVMLSGYAGEGKFESDGDSVSLPNLRILHSRSSPTSFNRYILEKFQITRLSELSMNGLSAIYPIENLFNFLLPLCNTLEKLSLNELAFGSDQIKAHTERNIQLEFSNLLCLDLRKNDTALVHLFAGYEYPVLHELKTSGGKAEHELTKDLWLQNAPNIPSVSLYLDSVYNDVVASTSSRQFL